MNKFIKRLTALAVMIFALVLLVACDETEDNKVLSDAYDNLKVEQLLGDNENKDEITKDLTLKEKDGDVKITWKSNNTDVITNKGKVTRDEDEDVKVTLTATLKLDEEEKDKKFNFTVLKLDKEPEPGDDEPVTVKAYHEGDTGKFSEDETENNASLINLDEDLFTVLATVVKGPSYTNPMGLNKDGTIRLYSSRNDGLGNTLKIGIKDGYVITKVEFEFDEGNNEPFMGLLQLASVNENLTADDVSNNTLVKEDLSIGEFALTNNQNEGNKATQIWIKYINITYEKGEADDKVVPVASNEDKMQEALDDLNEELLLGSNENKDKVTTDLNLVEDLGEVSVTWDTSNEDVVNKLGKVTRTVGEDKTVTLTATLTIEDLEETKQFKFTVLGLEEDELVATLKFEGKTGNMTEGNNAEAVGLDEDLFEVTSTARQIAPINTHVGLNKDGTIRLYGASGYIGKNTVAVTIHEDYEIVELAITLGSGSNNPTNGLLMLGDEKVELTEDDLSGKTLTYDDLSIDGLSLRNNQDGGSKNTQIWIEEITITYKEGKAESNFMPVETVKVTIDTKGGKEIAPRYFEEGDEFTMPNSATKEGYDFDGWYLDEDYEVELDLDMDLEEDITVYAKWAETADEDLVLEAKNALSIDTEDILEEKTLDLPTEGLHDATITWEVLEGEEMINLETGLVTLPNETKELKLKATLTINDAEEEKEFTITVVVFEHDYESAKLEYPSGKGTINAKADENIAEVLGLDEDLFDVEAIKGSAGNNLGLNNAGNIRFYFHANGGTTMKVSIANGYRIREVHVQVLGTAGDAEFVLGDDTQVVAGADLKSTTTEFKDLDLKEFTMQNVNETNTQIHLKSITIFYEEVEEEDGEGFETLEELKVAFLTDYHAYLNSSDSLDTFIHDDEDGSFDGTWLDNMSGLYVADGEAKGKGESDLQVRGANESFITTEEYYDKWFVFMDFLDDLVFEINPDQNIWGSSWVGNMRIESYMFGESPFTEEMLERWPEGYQK